MEGYLLMIMMFFDRFEKRIADIDTITSCQHTENEGQNILSVLGFNIPKEAKYVAFRDLDGDLQLFEIRTREDDPITKQTGLYAEHDYYELLTDFPIEDIRPTNVQAGLALTQALNGTRWQPGNIIETGLASTRWYYIPHTTALADIAEKWGVRLKPRITVSGAHISGRYIDIKSKAPVWRGKRFEIGKDILSAKYILDDRNVITALIGRGKGEETGDGYGRRIDFSDVVWSKGNGDPANKPAGQNYVEDPEATVQYGILGTRPRVTTKVYGDITEPAALLAATWADLQTVCQPVLSSTITAMDLERIGFPHEAARYGDEVAFIADGIRARASIVSIVREYAQNGQDVLQLGALRDSVASSVAKLTRSMNSTAAAAAAGAAIAQQNPSLLQGYLDTMITRILSTGTHLYTDPLDGGLVLESADGTTATKITGQGHLCANAKIGGQWQWRTAIDGNGIVADMITVGILRASLIKILGTDLFYWDASNIFIISPDDHNKQIRIGCYDGTNYGIGYTKDGGQTWKNAIGFDGVVFSVDTLQNQIDTQGNALTELNELVTTSFRVTGEGVIVGKSNVPTSVLVAADRVAIRDQHNNEVTKVTDSMMEIENARIRKQLEVGYVAQVKMSDGSCAFKWIGEEL